MGKISVEAEAEIEKCAMEADWYAEHGPQMFADAPAPTGKVEAYVSGYGRELSHFGAHAFVNPQTVWIESL